MGCSDIIAGVISAMIQSGGCGGCDCASCGACDCSSCGACSGCAIDCSPFVRDTAGRAQGFHGVHDVPGAPGSQTRRIPNTIQARLTPSGYSFLTAQIPNVIPAALPNGVDLGAIPPFSTDTGFGTISGTVVGNGSVNLELRNFSLTPQSGNCIGNPTNAYDSNRATPALDGYNCARLGMAAYYKTCDRTGGCTGGEPVNVDVTVTGFGLNDFPLNCILTLDGDGVAPDVDAHDDGLVITADAATIPTEGPSPRRDGYSRVAILDAQADETTLEKEDVNLVCPTSGPYTPGERVLLLAVPGLTGNEVTVSCNCTGTALQCVDVINNPRVWMCNVDPHLLVDNTIDDLGPDLNDDIDALVNDLTTGMLCYQPIVDADCPTGTTFVAASGGAKAYCNIAASGNVPAHCMESLAGLEARVGMGSALASISPGIESVVDFVIAAAGNMETAGGGTNLQLFGGIEGWMAGIRSLPHNPCVPIEHPANAAADCTALGSGYEYEAITNVSDGTTFSGRCVPRIPIVPLAPEVRGDVPDVVGPAPDDADYEIGVGVSTSFIDYAAWKIWDTGVTCLNVGSWLDPTLSPSLIAFALISPQAQPRVFFPINTDSSNGGSTAASNRLSVALSLAPQNPPVLEFDDSVPDPCQAGDTFVDITATLNELHIDLSVWGNDRYQRVGTIDTDVVAVVRIDIGPQVPGAGNTCMAAIADGTARISLANLQFLDAHWLPDASLLTPADFTPVGTKLRVQSGLDTIGGVAGGIAAGLIPELDLDALVNGALDGAGQALGGAGLPIGAHFDSDSFQILESPNSVCQGAPYDTGARGTDTNCTHEHFGVYVDLVTRAPGSPLVGMVNTTLTVTNRSYPADPAVYDLQSESFGVGETPSVEIAMAATGVENVDFEYSYRTAYTDWSTWQRSPYAVLTGSSLLLQGTQTIFARARVAGDAESVDETPATETFVVDVTPPLVELYEQPGGDTELQAVDLVSGSLSYRVLTDGEWSDWQPLAGSGVASIELDDDGGVEVRDESGNVAARGEALQGRPNAANSAACGCTTAGATTRLPLVSAFGLLAVLGLAARRRRARATR